jgi:hypothetical protein
MKRLGKKGMEIEMLVAIIIIIVFLVLSVIGYIYLKAKGINAIDYIKNIFRFGR